MKYMPGNGVSVFQEPTNRANGLTRDLQGRLIACEHDTRRVTRQELDGSITVIANSFQGRQLNRPNDVVVKSDGCIYFTDPWTSPVAARAVGPDVLRRLPRHARSRHDDAADRATSSCPTASRSRPTRSVLYINDSRRGHIRAFDLLPNGTLAKQTDRVFADLRGAEPGVPDGMKVDIGRQRLLRRRRRDYGSWIRRARSSAASCTALPPPPTSPSAATTGRRSTSPAGLTWARST